MKRVTLIPGDGIGPSVVSSAREVIAATGVELEWIEALAGESAHAQTGTPLPQKTLDSIAETRLALKGPCTTPIGPGFSSVNVALRQEFDLFANVRPVRAFPGVKCLFPDLVLTVVRENTQGLYSSMEHWIGPGHGAAMGIGVNTRPAMVKICRYAFEYARAQHRKKVTAVHKANILKLLSGLFLEVAEEVAPDYPDIEFESRIVDNMAMQMVLNPHQFDVIVSTNLFGDILSDLAAGLVGGLGFAPGANIGDDVAIFEAVHGSAPDIAGRDIANPVAVILAGAALLAHIGELDASARIHRAVGDVIADGRQVTLDINPESGVGTRAMTEAIVSRVNEL